MTSQKRSLPPFASVISVLSILLYCAGFLIVELELNEHKRRINALENVAEAKTPTSEPNLEKTTKNVPEGLLFKLNRNRRNADSRKTCLSCRPGPPGPPGPKGQRGSRGRRGQKGRTGGKGDRGIMGSPGKSGKQGIIGPVGPQGEAGPKGQKGDMGLSGLPGAKGEPGQSISAPTVAVSPAKLTVNETGSASFQCSVSGNPEPEVMWSKMNQQTGNQSILVSGATLRLRRVEGNNSGAYHCLGTNILGKAQATVYLEVNARPQVSIILGPHYAFEGSTFNFPPCHVTGHPEPTVAWRRSSGELPLGRVHYNNSGLQLSRLRKSDSDAYFCSAVNLLGEDESKVLLIVVPLPQFIVKPPVRVDVGRGGSLTLACKAIGDPQPVISWAKENGQLPSGRSQVTKEGLIIRQLKAEDTGNYTCVALTTGLLRLKHRSYVKVVSPGSQFWRSSRKIMGARKNEMQNLKKGKGRTKRAETGDILEQLRKMVAEEPEDEGDFLELHPSKSEQPVQMASNTEVPSPEEEAAKVLKSVFKCTICLNTVSLPAATCAFCYAVMGYIPYVKQWYVSSENASKCPLCRTSMNYVLIPIVREICNLLGQPIHNTHNGASEESDTDTIYYPLWY